MAPPSTNDCGTDTNRWPQSRSRAWQRRSASFLADWAHLCSLSEQHRCRQAFGR